MSDVKAVNLESALKRRSYDEQLECELIKLREQNRMLREALRFYADPQTYGKHGGSVNRVIADGGAIAKDALTATSQPHGVE